MAETLNIAHEGRLIWNQIIRGRYQASFQFNDKDIQKRLQAKHPEGVTATQSYDYTLRPILFIVRARLAERGLRGARQGGPRRCANSRAAKKAWCARGLRFVAVRPRW